MKLFIQTFLGIVALIAGISFLYFFMSGLSTGFNVILLLLSLILIGIGSYLFFRVSKIANAIPQNSAAIEPVPVDSGSKLLEKNNQMIKDYNQQNSKKDNLKAVQIAVGAEATTIAEEGK